SRRKTSNKILEELSTMSATSTSAKRKEIGNSRSSGLGAKGKKEEKKWKMEKK
ncbi:12637_t:CDS:2, partial [Entrophospora sp. SA101]